MVDREFQIGELSFKLRKIDAIKQFQIARRVAPLLSEIVPVMAKLSKAEKNMDSLSEEQKLEQFTLIAQPVLKGISNLSDEDSDKLLYGLLSAVEMQQKSSGNWAMISNGNQLMFQDLDLAVLLQAAGRAFMYNMSGFFGALQRSS